MSIFQILFYQPTFNLVVVLYRLFSENIGLAIIAVAIISRLITYPITQKQIRSAKKNQDFKLEYDKVKNKYKRNEEKQKEELAKLQMKYLPSQLGGCLPIILQIILLVQIRNAIISLVVDGVGSFNAVAYPFVAKFAETDVININFLGMDLSKVANNFGWSDISVVLPYVLLAVAVGLSQLFSSKVLMGIRQLNDENGKKKEEKEVAKKDDTPDMTETMQKANQQMIYFFPLLTIAMSLGYLGGGGDVPIFPSGISLFWTVQSLFIVFQEMIMNRKIVKEKATNFLKKYLHE